MTPSTVAGTAALLSSLLFYAGYDQSFDADYSAGSGEVLVVEDRYPPRLTGDGGGKYGGAAVFSYGELDLETVWTHDVLRYPVRGNFPYSDDEPFDGAIGMWLQVDMEELTDRPLIWLDPVHMLPRGDRDVGKIWMDFVTRELDNTPLFRFGATVPDEARNGTGGRENHVIIVPHIDFRGGEWHHVVGTWKRLNADDDSAVLHLYFDGERVGEIEGFSHRLDWSLDEWEIRVGLAFRGKIDEFFILDRFVHAEEVAGVYESEVPLGDLTGKP